MLPQVVPLGVGAHRQVEHRHQHRGGHAARPAPEHRPGEHGGHHPERRHRRGVPLEHRLALHVGRGEQGRRGHREVRDEQRQAAAARGVVRPGRRPAVQTTITPTTTQPATGWSNSRQRSGVEHHGVRRDHEPQHRQRAEQGGLHLGGRPGRAGRCGPPRRGIAQEALSPVAPGSRRCPARRRLAGAARASSTPCRAPWRGWRTCRRTPGRRAA